MLTSQRSVAHVRMIVLAVTAALITVALSIGAVVSPAEARKVNEYEGQHITRKVNEYEGQHIARKVNEYEGQH